MLVKIRRKGEPVESITSPEGAALRMAQAPGGKFSLRAHDKGTNPHARVVELLNGEWNCSMVDDGTWVSAHARAGGSL